MYYRDEDKNRTGDLDYFAGFIGQLTGKDPDDLEFYQKPPILSPRIFTMEDKLAYDEKERQIQIILDGWQKRWGGK
tara:strand:+ start:156 stop:383 length:228 start_codon:yes stop_codon:yes gene_type:complete